MSSTTVVVAKRAFSVDINGAPRSVKRGETFRKGHPVVEGREHLFKPFKVDNEIEQATAAPGEKRRGGPKRGKKAAEKVEEKQATAAPGEKPAPEDGCPPAESGSTETEATADGADAKEAAKSSADKE